MVRRKRPEVFGFEDAGTFLRAWIVYLKQRRAGFSLRSLAKRARVSVGLLPMILNGKRPLSIAMFEKISPHLGLSVHEHNFVIRLIHFSQAPNTPDRMQEYQRLTRSKTFQKLHPEEMRLFGYLSHWTMVAIRELMTSPDFRWDAVWIRDRLRYPPSLAVIEASMRRLERLKMVHKGADGRWVVPPVSVDRPVFGLLLRRFHQEVLRLASVAIDEVPPHERHLLGHTFALNATGWAQAKTILDQTLTALQQLEADHPPKDQESREVYHVELVGIPLTRMPKGVRA